MTTDPRRKVSTNQERSTAAAYGARQHHGSGSGRRPNDMHTDGELIECKTTLTGKKQITIKAEDLKSLCFRAALEGRDPVLHVRLESAPRKNWVLIPEEDHLEQRNGPV